MPSNNGTDTFERLRIMLDHAIGSYSLVPSYGWDDINSNEDLEVAAAQAVTDYILTGDAAYSNVGAFWAPTAQWLEANGHKLIADQIRSERGKKS